jgi:uncharacterized protein involved in response to NO
MQLKFEIRFIWWALALAVFAGFAIGAHVASVIGLELPLGKGFASFIQAHGHLQLVGWAGLFIIGISLHFIPRLAGVPIQKPSRISLILWLASTGLILRSIGQTLLPYFAGHAIFGWINALTFCSGLLEFIAIVLYLITLVQTIRGVTLDSLRPALQSVKPFFQMMFAGWLVYSLLNLFLLLEMAAAGEVVVAQNWNEFAIQIFLNLVLLPVAFAFSARLFPLYLRLPAIDWQLGRFAGIYFISVCLQLLPTLPAILSLPSQIPFYLSAAGKILKGAVVLWFIWRIDVLTRRRAPWTAHRVLQPGPERRPTREGLPDYGEFGCFEWLIYAAYFWLIVAVVLETTAALSSLLAWRAAISSDAIRHAYLLGFITNLILGMAVRMLPGFIQKKQVAHPKLVAATFWLANAAAVTRVAPLLLPAGWLEPFPVLMVIVLRAFALSGVFGLAAVICLAMNLIKTAR